MEVGVSAPVLWEKNSTRGNLGRLGRLSMPRSAASCKSHHMRAPGVTFLILISFLLSVDAAGRYTGVYVSKRKDSPSYHCEVTFLGTSPREKIWVGTYPTEELAAVACDVVFYYTNRPSEFNLMNSEDAIRLHCEARSAYENLDNWDDRRKFIKAEANHLIRLLSSPDQTPELRWEDVAVPQLVSVRRRAGEIAGAIVEHFCNEAERLQEFMTWLKHLLDAESRLSQMEYPQTQHREAHIPQVLPLGGDRILDVHGVMLLVESLAWPGRNLWLAFITGSLPMIFRMFDVHTKTNARHVEDDGDNDDAGGIQDPNDVNVTDRKTLQSEPSTKRQKVEHPSVSDRVQALLTAISFDFKNEAWQCTGYDLLSNTWKALPPFSYLPDPDPDLFTEYSVCGHGGLMCANVSKGELVVFNPLTKKKRTLPPLLHPRNPVLMHMIVDCAKPSYKVIVAGSSSSTDGHLSKKMEVFDSTTSKWEGTCDVPGPAFGLNKYQTGVCVSEVLFFISFLEPGDDGCQGVVAFDVENRKWLPSMTCPLPRCLSSGVVQLVENDGKVYLFYEHRHRYEQCIDVLEISEPNAGAVTCQWRNVVRAENRGLGGLHVNSEYVCVGFGEGKLCILNTLKADGVVYDTGSGMVCDVLEPRSNRWCFKLGSLDWASFTLQLKSEIDPTPPSVDDNQWYVTGASAGDFQDASLFPNEAKLIDWKKWQSATKRQNVEHPSIQLISDRVQAWFTVITFDFKNEAWQCTGYDLLSKTWRTLPPFSYLPDPDPALFTEYSVCGHGGLMCANISKGEVVVFNPLTGKKRTLPPLLHPRNPVLMHMIVDSATQSYKVIVAGSSSSTDGHLSKKMEVFDSTTSKWEETCDVPGPAFGLNEYQTGVYVSGILYFISFLEPGGCHKGVVAFDVENGTWLPSMTCLLPCPLSSDIVQLVENDGKVYLFYEHRQRYEQCIDVLETSDPNSGAESWHWRNVVRAENRRPRRLLVYPEYTCVGFGEGKLCIFNTSLQADGVVYDVGIGMVTDVLEPPRRRSDRGVREFFSLNPASFTLQLSSEIDPTPPTV